MACLYLTFACLNSIERSHHQPLLCRLLVRNETDGLVYVVTIACFSAHLTLNLNEIAAAEDTTELNYCDAINDALRIALKTDDSAVRSWQFLVITV